MPILGAHIPAAGGLYRAVERGQAIGCEAIQVFTKSPSRWEARPLTGTDVRRYQRAVTTAGMNSVVAHDAYLINLASPARDILNKSRRAFLDEMRRCERCGIPFLVTHTGAHLGSGEADGLKRLAESLHRVLSQTARSKVMVLLETTAGQGSTLGHRFEHLRWVMDELDSPERVGACLDTCHIFVAGYDLRTKAAYRKTMKEFGSVVGLHNLRCIHANDAKKPLGSRVDRHEHIGQGELGLEAFRLLVNDRRLQRVPILLETPESETMHEVNLETLRRLVERQTLVREP